PGTQVLILDNVIGATVPSLKDNAWRKISYQGQTLFVPMRYISVTPPDNAVSQDVQDVSFTQTSNEDDSTTASGSGTAFSTAPGSVVSAIGLCPGGCPCPPGQVKFIVAFIPLLKWVCCPQGFSYNPAANPAVACVGPSSAVTFYQATDGRIDGNAG